MDTYSNTFQYKSSNEDKFTINTPALRKLSECLELPDGWHYGGGRPTDKEVFDIAEKLIKHLWFLGLAEMDVFPGIDGDIQLTAYRQDHYIEIYIGLDQNISIIYEYQGECVYERDRIVLREALRELGGLTTRIWRSYESSTRDISIQNSIGFKVLRFETPLTILEYQSFPSNVSSRLVAEYVPTYDNIINPFLESLQFSGSSARMHYQTATG